MASNLQQGIKTTLSVITKALKQIPTDKRIILTSRVNDVLSKYKERMQTEQSLSSFKKQLEFNLNFIKLSNPNLDYEPPTPQEYETNQQAEEKDRVKVTSNDFQVERLKEDIFDTQLQRESSIREQVEFSNWFEGNADPEHLKKHKDLLERQHFSGEYWKGKQKPKSPTKEYLKSMIASGQIPESMRGNKQVKDMTPQQFEEGDQYWQKVKR